MIGKNKQGVYFYSIYYKDSFGNRKQKKVENKEWKTKKEVKQALELYLLQTKDDTSRITVDQLYSLYITNRKDKLKLRSMYTRMKAYEKHIEPFFKGKVVSEINNSEILEWQRALVNQGYKNRYLETIQEILKSLFSFGVKYDYISRNPFKIETLKNRDEVKQEMRFWSSDEFNQFIQFVDEPIYNAFFSLLFWTGLREGEAIALLKSDIDFFKGTVNVNKNYDFVNHVVTSPKTSTSYRVVILPDFVLNQLQSICDSYKQIYGYNDNVILFGFNRYLAPTSIKRKQKQACELAKITPIRIHDFRHSHVSTLIHLGFSPFEIAKRLGHSVSMVNDVYGHLFPEKQQLMVDQLNKLQSDFTQKRLKN